MNPVTVFEDLYNRARTTCEIAPFHHRLMQIWVEWLPQCVDLTDAKLLKARSQQAPGRADAVAQRLICALNIRGLQRLLKAVGDTQYLARKA